MQIACSMCGDFSGGAVFTNVEGAAERLMVCWVGFVRDQFRHQLRSVNNAAVIRANAGFMPGALWHEPSMQIAHGAAAKTNGNRLAFGAWVALTRGAFSVRAMRNLLIVPVLVLSFTLGPARAAAMDLFAFADLRVGAETMGKNAEVESGGSISKLKWSSPQRYSADLLVGNSLLLFGVAYGVGATYDKRSGSGYDQISTIGHAQVGPYLSLGPVRLELLGLAGRGTSKLRAPGGEDSGSVDEYGASLGLSGSILHIVIGARVGWLKQRADFTVAGNTMKVTSSDYTTGVFAGWRF